MSAQALRQSFCGYKIWSLAAALAALLHLGAAAALLSFSQDAENDEMGAPAIEISLAPAAPRILDGPDLPPGPLADEASASAPSAASAAKREANHPDTASVEAEDAEFTHSEKTVQPVEETLLTQQAKAINSLESSASEAAAPPKTEVLQEAPKPAAPAPGTDKAAQAARVTWQKALMAHLNRHKRYHTALQHRSAEVSVSFTLDRSGRVVDFHVKRSSGHPAIDEAALSMMKRANPVPAPPPAVADEGLTFEVPVLFRAGRH
ncbi:MAG TPA: TonB family protein [Methylocella sp.]|nr:TonB family protein [Methylocella sp.]